MLALSAAAAQEGGPIPVKVTGTLMKGYARLILDFPGRLDLPGYKMSSENGVLVLSFSAPLRVDMPDLSTELEGYVSAARVDPDGRGLRFGLERDLQIHKMEAGEKLFIDLLPPDWKGMPPGLPDEVVAELAKRSKEAALEAERVRKAELIRTDPPEVTLKVGRNPTFVRLQFDWSRNIKASFDFHAPDAELKFDLPMPIDLYPILSEMPKELVSVKNRTTLDDSVVDLKFKKGVVPRFYSNSKQQYVIDFDREGAAKSAVDLASLLPESAEPSAGQSPNLAEPQVEKGMSGRAPGVGTPQGRLVPVVKTIGATLRISFPFDTDTAAAVFRRGDVLWLLFDTATQIEAPAEGSGLSKIAAGFDVVASGETQIVRIPLVRDRLATLASEGRSWVLSLGDVLLTATDPMRLTRVPDGTGKYAIEADLDQPAKVHQLRDPDVGDVLDIVTAFAPSKGVPRPLKFVDFTALASVHGLVIKPNHEDVKVAIVGDHPVISMPNGLTVSSPQTAAAGDLREEAKQRNGFIDFSAFVEKDPVMFRKRLDDIMQRAADGDKRVRDTARLELARYYIANQLFYEAIGVTEVLGKDLSNQTLAPDVALTKAIALTMAGRSKEALEILGKESMSGRIDALMWRTIARVEARDFKGARQDALSAEPIVDSYPRWVRNTFLMSGAEAGIEDGDSEMALRFLGEIQTADLDKDQLTQYELDYGRLDEAAGRFDEALDTYGEVISADVRPTRAAAIYDTIRLLDRMGRLDIDKGAKTLAAESMVWRGDKLEAKMLALLANLYFRSKQYRAAFETVKDAALSHPDDPIVSQMLDEAREVFADLYLNGQADEMDPIKALTLYYDFRQFTPPGARGDEMVRNLARRLIKFDLLDQAAKLLDYQVRNRLEGAAKAQVGADLAVVYLADRKPDRALKALHESRLAGLSPALERQRRILEARALLDAGRDVLARDLLSSIDGRDADLLRVDADWQGKRYQTAAEILERLYTSADPDMALSPQARAGVIKAAVGFVLAGDNIGLSRLRQKFASKMANSPDWPVFNFVTGPVSISSVEFRKVAQEVAGIDTLDAFLKLYRAMYEPDGALAPEDAISPKAKG